MSASPSLAAPSDPGWAARAVAHLDEVLVDHAHCEKKAASTAVSLLFTYAEHTALLAPLARLAREELVHFERVLAPGGYLDVSTDVREYFDEILDLLAGGGLRTAVDPLFPIESPSGRTSYEAKYLLGGRPIHRASFVRDAGASVARPAEVRESRR